jgi:hypothetical protein
LTDKYGNRKATLIITARTAGSQARSEEANEDLVDQTREEIVGVNGRKAMGPVGRKR